MKYYTIRIDEELMEYLRKHARPYEEREPNDTLRKCNKITDSFYCFAGRIV